MKHFKNNDRVISVDDEAIKIAFLGENNVPIELYKSLDYVYYYTSDTEQDQVYTFWTNPDSDNEAVEMFRDVVVEIADNYYDGKYHF